MYPTPLTRKVDVGFFNWAAPMFRRADRRWTADDVATIASWLQPAFESPDGRLLDVGGGTGALASHLAENLGVHATVLDPTPQMLAYAQARPGLEAVLGEAQAIPFADDTFDAIVVNDAFHHMREQVAAIAEFRRIVRPGGLVLVLELDPTWGAMKLVIWVERLLGEPAAFLTPAELTDLMATTGIPGSVLRLKGPSYRFLGEVH